MTLNVLSLTSLASVLEHHKLFKVGGREFHREMRWEGIERK